MVYRDTECKGYIGLLRLLGLLINTYTLVQEVRKNKVRERERIDLECKGFTGLLRLPGLLIKIIYNIINVYRSAGGRVE